ncbi:oligosaccharide flippase family protein [Silvimonas iriomotensis]|uniref:Membrane protein involved in the export of O-antigen and teichoic acid n=1 Tax=Silvimonas iriomotensis TaxID=449662 RepID=A0ABQ2PEP8_9NEIS|nr:oligosaccharide flippase family protein [Silvimonas iriomotensis]GGP23737.1 hypothetical protein GCM10010970_37370 [Silvimonas iriomotensis]
MMLRAVSAQFLANAFAGGLSFLFTLWIAGRIGPADFAAYSFCFSVGSLVSILMDGGYHKLLLRETASSSLSDTFPARDLPRFASANALLVSGVALLVVLLSGSRYQSGLVAALLYFLCFIQGQFFSFTLRGEGRFQSDALWSLLQRSLAVLFAVLALVLAPAQHRVVIAFVAGALGLLLALLLALRNADVRALMRPKPGLAAGLVAIPFLLVDLGAMANFRIDILVQTALGMDPARIGHYSAAARIYEAVIYFAAVPLYVLTVGLRQGKVLDSPATLTRLVIRGMTAAVLLAGITMVAAPWLLALVAGESYRPAMQYLHVLLGGLLFHFPVLLLLAIGLSSDRSWRFAFAYCGAAGFNLVLSWTLVQRLGVVGAAWSNVATQALLMLLLVGCMYRLHDARAVATTA